MRLAKRTGIRAVLAAGVAVGLGACAGGGGTAANGPAGNPAGVQISGVTRDTTFRGTEPATPYRMPDITLQADNGDPFNLVHDTAYPVTLVFFGYAHCPDECPLILNELADVYRHLSPGVRSRTQVLFVTTDPRRDTAAALRAYVGRFDPRFVGLTGRLPDLLAAADSMGVAVSGMEKLPGGGYDVGHSIQVIGFRGDEAPVIWMADTPAADIEADVRVLAR